MRLFMTAIAALLLLTATPVFAGTNLPKTIVLSPEVLYRTKRLVLQRAPSILPAFHQLIAEANQALKAPIESVTYKAQPGPSGDLQDYWSLSPYWWPNPKSPNGMPYMFKDGEPNPQATSNAYDRARLSRMAHNALTLAQAWYLTENEEYASKGTALLHAWFGDPVTRATPDMRYAQSRPGVADGHHSGIMETRDLIKVVDAARLLEPSYSWSKSTTRKLEKWFTNYTSWLMKSGFGRLEALSSNNHGTWFDAQIAVYAAYTGNKRLVRLAVGTAERRRIVPQIMPNGSMPHELKRNRSRHYTFFNLEAFFVLASVGERMKIDLWNWADPIGPSIRQAMNFAAPYLNPTKEWPYGSTGAFDPYRYVPLFRRAALVYKDERYLAPLSELPHDRLEKDTSTLFY